jgi:hypothetical protein
MREPDIDMIVPFGDVPNQAERSQNLHTVIRDYLRRLDYPHYRIVLVESGANPTQRDFANVYCDEYVFVEDGAEFSVGRTQNAGFLRRSRKAELVYFHQADFLAPPGILKTALALMRKLECPFVYPYWGEIHLSRTVSAGVRKGIIDGARLVATFSAIVAEIRAGADSHTGFGESSDYREVHLAPAQLRSLARLLPAELAAEPAVRHERAWGTDDRAYAPYRWADSQRPGTAWCRISPGPRASAGYLCTDAAFRRVGGVVELPGWGYEDLLTWLNVQACYDYRADTYAVHYRTTAISRDIPLVHLWHPVGQRPAFYAHTADNEAEYRKARARSPAQRRRAIRPLPAASGRKGAAVQSVQRDTGQNEVT